MRRVGHSQSIRVNLSDKKSNFEIHYHCYLLKVKKQTSIHGFVSISISHMIEELLMRTMPIVLIVDPLWVRLTGVIVEDGVWWGLQLLQGLLLLHLLLLLHVSSRASDTTFSRRGHPVVWRL